MNQQHLFSNNSSRGLIKNSIIKEAEKIKASVDSLEIVSVDSSDNLLIIKNMANGKGLFFLLIMIA